MFCVSPMQFWLKFSIAEEYIFDNNINIEKNIDIGKSYLQQEISGPNSIEQKS